MTGACGFRWHLVDQTSGVISMEHALLCSGTLVAGPGVTYRLRFQAAPTNPITEVRFQNIQISKAGPEINPVRPSEATVVIGTATGLPGDTDAGPAIRLGNPFPNPFRLTTRIPILAPGTSQARLEVFDIRGRRIRLLDATAPGVLWDGRDEHGRTAPTGVYMVRLTADRYVDTRRVIRIK